MRPDIAAPASSRDRTRANIKVATYPPETTPREVALGLAVDDEIDLTDYVDQLTQSDTGASLRLMVPRSYDMPGQGRLISIKDGQTLVFAGVIESAPAGEIRGARRDVTVQVRRRDAGPKWRDVKAVGSEHWAGTDLGHIARDVAANVLELEADEYSIPNVGVIQAQDRAQLANLSPWEMLTAALAPGMAEPFVDGRGLLRKLSRDVQRKPDYVLSSDDVVGSIIESAGPPAPTAMRVKYVDPRLARVDQSEKLLATETAAVGFISNEVSKQIWFSLDQTQRVAGVYLKVVGKPEQHIADVGDTSTEELLDVTPFGCTLHVQKDRGSTLAALGAIALAGPGLGGTLIAGFDVFTGGTLASAFSDVFGVFGQFKDVLLGVGVGTYEIWGTPYDYVHLINTVEAYNTSAPDHTEKIEVFESNLIPNQDAATALAAAELFYRISAATPVTIPLVEDYRYEPGDLVQLADGRILYIVPGGVQRDLSPRAAANVSLTGFWVGGQYRAVKKW